MCFILCTVLVSLHVWSSFLCRIVSWCFFLQKYNMLALWMFMYLQLMPALTWLYNRSIQSIFGVLIHYCASSMVCEFLLLLQALTQYVMCREIRIWVSSILGNKELGQGSKQRCWLLGARSSKMAHHGMWRPILLPGAVLFIWNEMYSSTAKKKLNDCHVLSMM